MTPLIELTVRRLLLILDNRPAAFLSRKYPAGKYEPSNGNRPYHLIVSVVDVFSSRFISAKLSFRNECKTNLESATDPATGVDKNTAALPSRPLINLLFASRSFPK